MTGKPRVIDLPDGGRSHGTVRLGAMGLNARCLPIFDPLSLNLLSAILALPLRLLLLLLLFSRALSI